MDSAANSAALPDSKRIKTTPPTPPTPTQPSSLSITDLTDDHLVSIASYLPGTSCVNLAVALSAESSGDWLRSDTSKAIISASQDSWETLDFADFGNVVANKLSDDDISTLLVCIDAENKVKTLRLGSCTLLVGHGLEPLRGSTVLEDIDLRGNTVDGQTTPFSQASILSILENILDMEGGLKKHLNMGRDIPKEWRRDNEFVQNLKQLLLSKGTCEVHDMNCSGESSDMVACTTCFWSLCDDCRHIDGYWIITCDNCGVSILDSCENFAHCVGCGSKFCSVCKDDEDFAECDGCYESYCSVCKDDVDVDAALQCGERYCYESLCLSCGPRCEHCLGLHAPKLIARNERLAGDNETLKNENSQLRQVVDENNQLRQEIEELRKWKLGILAQFVATA